MLRGLIATMLVLAIAFCGIIIVLEARNERAVAEAAVEAAVKSQSEYCTSQLESDFQADYPQQAEGKVVPFVVKYKDIWPDIDVSAVTKKCAEMLMELQEKQG